MKPTARALARRVLARVREGAYTTLALAGELQRSRLDDNDRGLATELAYGVLKRRLRLDRALGAHAPRGLGSLDDTVLDALRVAAYQILFLRVPAHAAVDDAVEAVKERRGPRMAGFANALLRRLAASGEPPLPVEPRARLAAEWSAPGWLLDAAITRFGEDEAGAFLAALDAPPPTWLRAHLPRGSRDELAAAIAAERPRAMIASSEILPEALSVRHGGDLSTTAAWARGLCAVQDLGAQLAARLCEPGPGERILDACAGVGGKSAHLAALAGEGAVIDAADASERKLELARDTAHRLGLPSLRTIACDLTDPEAPLAPAYDRILVDAPCSGLGVLRRHPEARWRDGLAEVPALAGLQRRLLDALAPRVRPGGILVYSVCTFTDEEGPAQVDSFLHRHADFEPIAPPPLLAPACAREPSGLPSIRSWPHRHDADAFFAVRLRRRG